MIICGFKVIIHKFPQNKKMTWAEKIINFNRQLEFPYCLPNDFEVLNPFLENPETFEVNNLFYQKFYADDRPRKLILGINPGRHGAGVTGVPFTDTKRLASVCGIEMQSAQTHEVSSVFIYDMIEAAGGIHSFYNRFFINSPFPLAIVRNENSRQINANYYDDAKLFSALKPYMKTVLNEYIRMGFDKDEVYILGKKNAQFIQKLNSEEKWFRNLVVLDHPRYIQQYKFKFRDEYIAKYLNLMKI